MNKPRILIIDDDRQPQWYADIPEAVCAFVVAGLAAGKTVLDVIVTPFYHA